MRIDWFTVGAQILNFLVLLWLLKRFLYMPILQAMARREKSIADNLEQAASAKQAAEAEQALFSEKNREFDEQHETMLEAAKAQAEQELKRLLELARQKVERQQAEWETALAREQAQFQLQLQKEVQQEMFLLAEKFLREFAGVQLERQMVDVFLERLQEEIAAKKFSFISFAGQKQVPISVYSAFWLTEEDERKIKRLLQENGIDDPAMSFDRNEALLCGIEIVVENEKYSWTMKEYLTELAQAAESWQQKKGRQGDGT